WVVDEDIVVTNRHVAEEFCSRSGSGFVFRRGWPNLQQRMAARIDFLEEQAAAGAAARTPREFRILDVLYIEDEDGPDLAFYRVPRGGAPRTPSPPPPPLASRAGVSRQYVATIGYPAADSRIPDQDLVRRLFGDVYNVKRLAPGQIARADGDLVLHDCSTL